VKYFETIPMHFSDCDFFLAIQTVWNLDMMSVSAQVKQQLQNLVPAGGSHKDHDK
jgi:hypothetical protein